MRLGLGEACGVWAEPATDHEAGPACGRTRAPCPNAMKRRRRDDGDDGPLQLRDTRGVAPPSLADVVAAADRDDAPERLLAHLLHPLSVTRFEAEVWERRALHVSHGGDGRYLAGLFSTDYVRSLLAAGRLRYGLHVDVTRYDAATGRSTLNDGQRVADAAAVWTRYADGCSVRVLHPQRWCDPLFAALGVLERHFRCAAGSNAYLTPAGTQGFAPHYDDVDAFVLQCEGRKRWRLYAPRDASEVLPRVSSPNFREDELGSPTLDVVLEPGDILYMPRGCIHQAVSLPESHSLHVTLSTGHANTWADLFELALPAALAEAAEEMPALRAGLPRKLLDCLGVMHAPEPDAEGDPDGERGAMLAQAQSLLRAVLERMPLDAAADQLGARFMRTRLAPPRPGGSRPQLGPRAKLRLRFAGAARLAVEGDEAVVYHPFANERLSAMEGYGAGAQDDDASEEDAARLVFDLDAAPSIEALLRAHPAPVELRALPGGGGADDARLAAALLDAGILVLEP